MATIVCGYEGRPQSRDALALAGLLGSAWEARVLAVWVPERDEPFSAGEKGQLRARIAASRGLKADAGELLDGIVDWDLTMQPASAPSRGLHDVAVEQQASAVVVGSSHLGPVGRAVLGSTAARLLVDAPWPIAVAPRGWSERERVRPARIGVGQDGCADCVGALAEARALAGSLAADLVELTVEEPKRAAEALAVASADLDLLVVGCRTCSGVLGRPLRSVSRRLMHTAVCPLLVVPQGVAAAVR
jgi:nucleotide-binding universal stress UspA family protein